MTSDKKYIIRAIKTYKNRNMLGVACLLFSIFFGSIAVYSYGFVTANSENINNSFLGAYKQGDILKSTDIKTFKLHNKLTYELGLTAGSKFGFFIMSAALSLGYALYFFLGARRERIIMELYDKSKI